MEQQPPSTTNFTNIHKRIEGKTALHDFIHELCSSFPPESLARDTAMVLDFDRTLTNGFSDPSVSTDVSRRIRGGDDTIAALALLKSRGVKMFVVTARGPRPSTIEQLSASFEGPQRELKRFFVDETDGEGGDDGAQKKRTDSSTTVEVTQCEGAPLARRGRILATDYRKATAVAQILETLETEFTATNDLVTGEKRAVHVIFVDDCVVNAYDVHVRTYEARRLATLTVLWWDTFIEEREGSMFPVPMDSSDFSYSDQYLEMRRRFGVTEEEEVVRLAFYREVDSKTKKREPEVKREVKKLTGLDEKFGGLLMLGKKMG